jgi:hypothetical protein
LHKTNKGVSLGFPLEFLIFLAEQHIQGISQVGEAAFVSSLGEGVQVHFLVIIKRLLLPLSLFPSFGDAVPIFIPSAFGQIGRSFVPFLELFQVSERVKAIDFRFSENRGINPELDSIFATPARDGAVVKDIANNLFKGMIVSIIGLFDGFFEIIGQNGIEKATGVGSILDISINLGLGIRRDHC